MIRPAFAHPAMTAYDAAMRAAPSGHALIERRRYYGGPVIVGPAFGFGYYHHC